MMTVSDMTILSTETLMVTNVWCSDPNFETELTGIAINQKDFMLKHS